MIYLLSMIISIALSIYGIVILEVNNDRQLFASSMGGITSLQDAHQTKKPIRCCWVSSDAKDWKIGTIWSH